uniref:Structural maintenance of chromosomes protein n=1 Tax=Xenopsylla cheopis TaxID=163159 RepID=A0A6M2DMN1_XENCH
MDIVEEHPRELRVLLSSIEVDNFKSYRGKLMIGPLKQFTAIIGPNGSGKSNFMDAVSFVMGEKTQSLRVKRLNELIHGANINRPISRTASVTATFQFLEGGEKKFQRIINGNSSEYKINGQPVTNNQYLAELEQLGINAKAKNFLVFQGAVESIAMKNPKERTALFEEISGSGALKEEYDKFRAEKVKAEEETQCSYQKKRGIAAERKEAKLEKEEAEKYKKLQEDLINKQIELQIFKLYHNEQDIQHFEKELVIKQADVQKAEASKEKAEEALKEKRKEQGTVNRQLQKIEQDMREVEVEISKKRPQFIKAKERVTHTQKKLESALKTLDQARKANEAHQNDIRKLEDERAKVESAYAEYENTIAGELQSRGKDVKLEEEQVHEYERLKEEGSMRSARYLQQLDSVNRVQKSDQDRLDNEIRKKSQIENQHRQKGQEKAEAQKRIEKLAEHIKTTEQALEEQKRIREELESDVGNSKGRVQELQSELDNIVEQLGDAKTDKHEDSRRKKKKEIVDSFKKEVPGVYDRMINMCQPQHKRYNVAVTKVLGKYMEAIVVDTEKTARKCIQILKEQRLEPETFLPLDYIQAKPLKERLRNIREPRNVCLLFDVLCFEPPAIERAVLFATNNALVCETPEDAMKVAYDLDGKNRYDALALDGTFYQKSGIISGGSLDLARKAKRWDEKHMAQLKAKKEKITDELREAMKKSRKESELTTVESQIRGLETRLRYSKNDKDTTSKQIQSLDREIKQLAKQMDQFGPNIAEIERTMLERDQKIQEIKESMNNVEDVVFAKFCEQIGVDNIRQYEERELRTQQERAKKKMEFEGQIDRITSNLEFEKSRDTQKNVQRWERTVQDDEDELETSKQAELKQRQDIDQLKEKVDVLKAEKQAKKAIHDAMEEEIGKARREVGSLSKDVVSAQKSVSSVEGKLESKKNERHNILMQCKMDSISIPFLSGSLDDVAAQDSTLQNGEGTSRSTASNFEKESGIQIDYSDLARDLRKKSDPEDIKKTADKMTKSVNSLEDTIHRIQAPNLKASQKLEEVRVKIQMTNEEFEAARKKTKKAKQDFDRVKQERHDKFMKCFVHVSNEIDEIYKKLAKNPSAQAFLGLENPEEPYLDGVNYNCVAPGKRFQPMSNLSGGEKTIAALALLFAIHSYQPAPFFVLDEIDAALDNTNIGKVAHYIRKSKTDLQTLVISLKEEFYCHADRLVGIVPEPADCLVSNVLTFDLAVYPP